MISNWNCYLHNRNSNILFHGPIYGKYRKSWTAIRTYLHWFDNVLDNKYGYYVLLNFY